MTNWLYLTQTFLIAATIFLLVRGQHWVLRAQTAMWMVAVSLIFLRYGSSEQLVFYSNDQVIYEGIVRNFASEARTSDLGWWTSISRIPYTLPAFMLHSLGISPALALKTVSLVCLLWLTNDVLKTVRPNTDSRVIITCLFTACGTIGVFFSTLALRETMMMLLATRFFLTKSPVTRVTVLLLLLLLRPHLGVCLAIASLVVATWRQLRDKRPESVVSALVFVIVGSLAGYQLYSLGNSYLAGAIGMFGHEWGIEPVTRIASNYFGVQFLTAKSETVEFSLLSLVLLRLVLVETVLIPTLFTVFAFVRPHRLNEQRTTLLLAFAIYVGLVTNTDFNSFRQNIPFMPVMGLAVLAMLPARTARTINVGAETSEGHRDGIVTSVGAGNDAGTVTT